MGEHILSRDGMEIRVSEQGAELRSLRFGDREWMWSGDPAVWGRKAPNLFPWCGNLKDGYYVADGKQYPHGPHGFARDFRHTLADRGENFLEFRLDWDQETLALYPWRFTLKTRYEIRDGSLFTTMTVLNVDDRPLPFQMGYHFAFALPLGEGRHEIRFETVEQAHEITMEGGFVVGQEPRFTDQDRVALTEDLFAIDSVCLGGLKSRWMELGTEAPGGPSIRVGFDEAFPYVLLWSKPGPMHFVCIEPWTGLPDDFNADHDLFHRPGVKALEAGTLFSCTQVVTPKP